MPRDWSMSVTFDAASRLGWAGGYAGHGVGAANISGRTLADLVLGRATDLRDACRGYSTATSARGSPEPLRFVGLAGDRRGSSDAPTRVRTLPAGAPS